MATKEDLQKLINFQERLDEFTSFLLERESELDYKDIYGFSPFQKILQETSISGEETFSGSLDLIISYYS